MDLLDLHRGRLSWRRLRVLIEHLPPESATMTAIRNAHPDVVSSDADPAQGRWSQDQMLLAQLVDEIRWLRWITVATNSSAGNTPPQPEPMPRPGVVSARPAARRLGDQQYDFLWRHINGLDTSESGLHVTGIDGGG